MEFKYKIINEDNNEFKVISLEDGFAFGRGKSVKGAMIGALISGIRLNTIDFNGFYVPINECLSVVK